MLRLFSSIFEHAAVWSAPTHPSLLHPKIQHECHARPPLDAWAAFYYNSVVLRICSSRACQVSKEPSCLLLNGSWQCSKLPSRSPPAPLHTISPKLLSPKV